MPKLLAWIVYVRWQSGQREAIRCTAPDEMIKRDGVWVMACVPVPAVTVVQRR
jgi:hypothetical protein